MTAKASSGLCHHVRRDAIPALLHERAFAAAVPQGESALRIAIT
jgi:hypothetical protein